MPGTRLWDGHDFSDDELEFWSQEIFAAAQELAESRRATFVAAACDGSESLRRRVESLLTHAWLDEVRPAFVGVCQPGEIVCDCFILRAVGRGGLGEVYKAIQRSLRRIVAIKVVTSGLENVRALAKEAATAARLVHPNIIAVYHANLQTHPPCILMEFVDGISLRQWLERHWRQSAESPAPQLVRSISRQVAFALGEAHRRGLIHGDLKPENILLQKVGEDYVVKVVDFGVARRIDTPAGPLVGTPGYVAPEQLQGSGADSRADLFSLGVTLYELLKGAHPFAGQSDAETYFRTLSADPEFPEGSTDNPLWRVARRLLQKAPGDRYATAEAVIGEFDRRETEAPEIVVSPLLSELPAPVQRWWERHRSGFPVAVFSFLWGCASLLLAIGAGAACIRVFWGGTGPADEHQVVYGYAVEPNAGLWYLVGASLSVLTGFGFIDAAQRGLARTRLLAAGPDGARDPHKVQHVIAAQNRRWFRYFVPAIAILATGFVAIPELAFRRDHAFGWVQADLAAEQVGQSYESLRGAGKLGEVPALKTRCDKCPELRVVRVVNGSSDFHVSPGVFSVFLLSALGHQIALVAFLLWIIAKILFFFGLLSTALLSDARDGLRLTPDFYDTDDYRFGLGRLDNVYYAILLLIAAAAIGLFLQVAANVSKGTYYFSGDPVPALFGQAVLLLGTLCLLAVLLVAPACVFLLLTIKAVDAELGRLSDDRKRLEIEIASARGEDHERLRRELERMSERRTIARRQRMLPLKQPGFLRLLAVVVIMLLIFPLSIQWLGRGSRETGISMSTIVDAVCATCGNPLRDSH